MKRFLRVGVFRAGKLVDDRYVSEKDEVSVGSAAENTVALSGSGLPKEHVLFRFDGESPLLVVPPGMSGELALDGRTREKLSALQSKGRSETGGWGLSLPDTARGWVSLGDTTFFFQIADKPAPPPKRELPKEVRGSFLASLEVAFIGILVSVLAVEGIAVFAIHQRPEIAADAPASVEDLDRFAEILMPEKPKEQPKPKEEEAKKPEDEGKKAEKPEEKAPEPSKEPAKTAEAEAARKEKVREAVSKKGLLNILGSTGGSGSLANVFASGAGFSDDISSALAGAGGVVVATGDDSAARKGGSGAGTVGIGDLDATVSGSSGRTTLTEKKSAPPQITFDDSAFEAESSTVDKDSLGKYIRMRIKSVQACYEKELKRNPTLKGKIVVRFIILTTGRVGEVGIDQNTMGDRAVADCIVNTVKRWSFPIKPEEDSPVSFPFVFSPGG